MFSHMEFRHNPHTPNPSMRRELVRIFGCVCVPGLSSLPRRDTEAVCDPKLAVAASQPHQSCLGGGGGVFPTRLSRQTRTTPVPYGVPWFIQPGKGTGAADSQRIPDFSPNSVMLLLGVAMCFVYASISIFIIYTVY